MKQYSKVEPIKETIEHLMYDLVDKKAQFSDEDPDGWLKKVLTKRELKHIKFNYFKKKTLYVSVDSSSWLYVLSLKKQDLVDKLKKISDEIKDINFRIGEV